MSRRGIAILLLGALVLALGAGRPARAGMPDLVEPLRKKQLSAEQYRHLRDEWKGYANAHPDDAHAWAELARASWYCNDPRETSMGYAEKAYRLGPDDPDACAELAKHRWVAWTPDAPASPDEAIRLFEHAASVSPDMDDAHLRLWVLRLAKGDRAGAEAELRSLLDRGRIPEPLVDYGYNELAGLKPNAILFTNGDNDTYPAVALQAARGFRTDVTVVNLSMLNLPWCRKLLREGPNPVPVPLLDQSPTSTSGGVEAMHAIVEQASAGITRRPVYFATTVARDAYDVKARLSLEGTVYRVLLGKGEAMQADTAQLERNFGTLYRLQSATSLTLDWNAWSTLGDLMRNYVASDVQFALARAHAGNRVGARRAFDRALRLCDAHHWPEATFVLDSWRKCDPQSRELAAWAKRLGK